jgi:NAD(P)-dependent dehydrogenase (short-subunit alcohol dehydrogenase family)
MNKTALITGANKGLGFETAMQLGKQGYTLLVTSRTHETALITEQRLKSYGYHAFGFILDCSDENSISDFVNKVQQQFSALDVLVNNAGVQLDLPAFMPANSTLTVSMEVLKTTFQINFFAPIALTQKLLPLLKASSSARIVNVSSIMGSLTLHADTQSPIYGIKLLAYNASKTALNQFTLHLAEAVKETNIKVNSAHPGWVKTDLGGEYAPMEIHEGAKTIIALCTMPENGPSGSFIHLGDSLPW